VSDESEDSEANKVTDDPKSTIERRSGWGTNGCYGRGTDNSSGHFGSTPGQN